MSRRWIIASILAILVQGTALIVLYRGWSGEKQELARLRLTAHRRAEFCRSYKRLLFDAQNDLAHHSGDDVGRWAMTNFRLLSSRTFFDVCEIDGEKLEPELEQAHASYLEDGNTRSAADAARDIIEAMPATYE